MSSIPREPDEDRPKTALRHDLSSAEAIVGYVQQLRSEWPTPHEGAVYRPQERVDRIWAAMDNLGLSPPACPLLPGGDGNFLVIMDDDQTCRALWRGFRDALRDALRVVLQVCGPDGAGVDTPVVDPAPPAGNGRGKKRPRVTINDRMKLVLGDNPEAASWTISQWVTHLGCARGGVSGTTMWKTLHASHCVAESERRVKQEEQRGLDMKGIDRRKSGRNID